MKQRIIFTVINDLNYDQRMQRICTSLVKNGYEVLLVGRKLKSSIPLQNQSYSQKRMHLLFTKGKLFYVEYNIRLFFFLLFKSFEIACGIDLDTIVPCYFVSVLKKKKCVYDVHEIFTEVPEVISRPFTQNIWKRVERYAITRIKNCCTVSQSVANYFQQKYSRHFNVIRNVPKKHESSSPQSSEKFIFYQGALNEGRGLEQTIEAMQVLDMKLKIAGEGDLSQKLRALTSQKNLSGKIVFLGRKTPDELETITSQAWLGLNLLENKGLSYYYSLANKFFDYVQSGVPQLCTNFPEYEIHNREFEVAALLSDLNPETIVASIQQLLTDKDLYFRLRNNCLKAKEEWNWQNEEPKLLAFYQQLQ